MTRITERLFYRIAKRWIAGYTIKDAATAAHDANRRNVNAILNRLGEHTPDRKLIDQYYQEYLRLLDMIETEKIKGTISVKPSQVGLALDIELYKQILPKILEKAEQLQRFVWIDMENSPYTEATIDVYREILNSHTEVGMCLQSNMKRTETDLRDLVPRGGKIRLVKGAYPENGEVAFTRRSDVTKNYLGLMQYLFEEGEHFAVATHDGNAIDRALSLAQGHKVDFEFQLLKGIRDDLKADLIAKGFRVSEYIPYGPEWYNYSKRRMRERKRNILLLLRSITG